MLYSIVGILVIIIDQAVKFWVSNTLFGTDIVKFIPGVISLVNIHNYGAAFGFLSGSGARIYFIIATGVFVLLVVIALATNFIQGKLARWSLVLVAAGGLGNMIDRVIYGYVQDMFKVELFNFAIFNVADIFITVFAIVFALAMFFEKPEEDVEELYEDEEEEEEEEEPKPRRKGKLGKKAKAAADEEEPEEEPAPRQSAVRTNRKARQDKYEREYEEYKAQQRAAMRRQAEQEAPAPAAAPLPAPAADDDPFAAWERANARVESRRADSYAGRVMEVEEEPAPAPRRPARRAAVREEAQPVPAPAPKPAPQPVQASKPAPQPVQASKPAEAPKPAAKPEISDDFSLDDILAEFK